MSADVRIGDIYEDNAPKGGQKQRIDLRRLEVVEVSEFSARCRVIGETRKDHAYTTIGRNRLGTRRKKDYRLVARGAEVAAGSVGGAAPGEKVIVTEGQS